MWHLGKLDQGHPNQSRLPSRFTTNLTLSRRSRAVTQQADFQFQNLLPCTTIPQALWWEARFLVKAARLTGQSSWESRKHSLLLLSVACIALPELIIPKPAVLLPLRSSLNFSPGALTALRQASRQGIGDRSTHVTCASGWNALAAGAGGRSPTAKRSERQEPSDLID